ncbi:MAG TPA: CBS domain-containing protein [Rhizobiales bacterium]|nr:CBS domain-containing protein [Hyphomicrobiales bacterium]
MARTAGEIMTPKPKSVAPSTPASLALEMLTSSGITSLFVLEDGKPAGIIHIHDLLHLGV